MTVSLQNKIYIWQTDGALPGRWQSNSWMYGPIQTLGTDTVIPMYLGQRHGLYKFNTEKTSNDQVYMDLMYNFQKTAAANWQVYPYNQTFTEQYL